MEILPDSKELTIFIPFMYKESRVKLFEACLRNVYELTKDDPEVEIVVHEVGPSSTVARQLIEDCGVVYGFNKWDESYHKAWSINQALKYFARGRMFVMLDADIIVDYFWVAKMKALDVPTLAWSRTINISAKATQHYLDTGFIDIAESSTRLPGMDWHAGISVACPRKLMIDVKGVPEDFRGTWGGEDNSFLWKLYHLGHYVDKPQVDHIVYHMDHEATTPLFPEYLSYVKHTLGELDKSGWQTHIDEQGTFWGHPSLNATEFNIEDLMDDLIIVCYRPNADTSLLEECLSERMPVVFPFKGDKELSDHLPFAWEAPRSKFNYLNTVMNHIFGNPLAIFVASNSVGSVFMKLVAELEHATPLILGKTIFNEEYPEYVIDVKSNKEKLIDLLVDRGVIK